MLQRLLFFLAMVMCMHAYAQQGLEQKLINAQHNSGHLRFSLITCSPGPGLTESFGHSAIRLIDSTKTDESRDMIYNYGTFNCSEQEFILQFFKGDVEAYLEVAPFNFFLKAYGGEHREVLESVLLLTEEQEDSLASFLAVNARIDHRYYDYDFVYDNCTTRIRDAIAHVSGKDVVFGNAAPAAAASTWRQAFEPYYAHQYFVKLLAGLFFSHNTDKPADKNASMYVPSALLKGFENTTVQGHKLCSDRIVILAAEVGSPGVNYIFIITLCIAVLLILGCSVKKLSWLGRIMSTFILIFTGLLGCIFLYTWIAPVHPMHSSNYNILWALPFNVIIPFLGMRARARYAVVAICLIIAAVVVHVLQIQVMPMFELAPVWLALLFLYLTFYRNDRRSNPLRTR